MSGSAPVLPLGQPVAGRSFGVLGLARSGMATVRALLAAGAQVHAWDSDAQRRADAAGAGARIADLEATGLAGMDALVLSPGVPLNTHPLATMARAAGVEIIGDIELFARARPFLPPHKVVGITGTNGKSTTTALVHHILKVAGIPALMGGNIGLPILSQAPLPAGGVYVLELSSYQIDLTYSLHCDVAVLLNITPDHLDRYDGDLLAYAASKARLFALQKPDQIAVIAADDDRTRQIASHVAHRCIRVRAADVDGAAQAQWPALQGPHNAQNIAAAVAICTELALPAPVIEEGLRTYPGLPHRMERVAEAGGITFVNDSKATNPEAAAPALAAFPPADGRRRIHWIAGGLAKGESLGACADHFGNVAAAYLIGASSAAFSRAIGSALPVTLCDTMDVAVAAAAQTAQPGDVVLLSPAAASFDQYRDFEARGAEFAMLARQQTARLRGETV